MDTNIETVTEGILHWCEWDIGRMGLGTEAEKRAKVAEMVKCLIWTVEQDPEVRRAFFASTELYGASIGPR